MRDLKRDMRRDMRRGMGKWQLKLLQSIDFVYGFAFSLLLSGE
jgi:hypothetical protein